MWKSCDRNEGCEEQGLQFVFLRAQGPPWTTQNDSDTIFDTCGYSEGDFCREREVGKDQAKRRAPDRPEPRGGSGRHRARGTESGPGQVLPLPSREAPGEAGWPGPGGRCRAGPGGGAGSLRHFRWAQGGGAAAAATATATYPAGAAAPRRERRRERAAGQREPGPGGAGGHGGSARPSAGRGRPPAAGRTGAGSCRAGQRLRRPDRAGAQRHEASARPAPLRLTEPPRPARPCGRRFASSSATLSAARRRRARHHEERRGPGGLRRRGVQHLHDLGGQQPLPAHHRTRQPAPRAGRPPLRPGLPAGHLRQDQAGRGGGYRVAGRPSGYLRAGGAWRLPKRPSPLRAGGSGSRAGAAGAPRTGGGRRLVSGRGGGGADGVASVVRHLLGRSPRPRDAVRPPVRGLGPPEGVRRAVSGCWGWAAPGTGAQRGPELLCAGAPLAACASRAEFPRCPKWRETLKTN